MEEEDFKIPVKFGDKILSLPARLLQGRYAYKIQVTIADIPLHFERDDEGNWRVLVSESDGEKKHLPDKFFLQAILESIEKILK